MPTIYVDNLSKLQRLSDSCSVKITRPVINVVKSVAGLEGEGFPVNRAFTNLSLTDLDPFIMMDEMGRVEYSVGEAKGTPWHPHRGFETVTYMIDGKIKHKDSQGGGGLITDGDTQWMTAGSGILHIEAPPEDAVLAGGLFHGIQIWVNLPRLKKWSSPKYQDIKSKNISLIASADAGSLIRVIAGNIGPGVIGPGSTMTPINFFHVTINPNSVVRLDWPKHFNAVGYALSGSGFLGEERIPISASEACLFGPGDQLLITGSGTDRENGQLELILLGGLPINEPVAWHGPFVMNTRQELQQAFDDYQSGKLGSIPALGQ